ncbi:alpha/beta fold hydrolase [Nocardia sp. N2S4-5]|uniref:alpha/beta fold hydrolase n=1 Tax=Nocardia sp. N2S4-5 TaxID=3351565 RepID=UPI0037D4E76E
MDVLTLGPASSRRVVLFAAGAGGDPERYLPLLEDLAAEGWRVVAPYFARFGTPDPPVDELRARPLGLVESLRRHGSPAAEVVVVGHSIGGWAGLCLAGASSKRTGWTASNCSRM